MKQFEVALVGSSGGISLALQSALHEQKAPSVVIGSSLLDRDVGSMLYRRGDVLDPVRLGTETLDVKTVIYLSARRGRFPLGSGESEKQGLLTAPDFTKLFSTWGLRAERLITIGSSEEYGPRDTPELISEDDRPIPLSSYGHWKVALFERARTWALAEGKAHLHLRPFVIYGPHQNEDMFLGSLLAALKNGRDFPMTTGEQWRSFCHVQTVVQAILGLIRMEHWPYLILNVSDDDYVQIRELAETVAGWIGRGRLRLGAIPYRQDEVWHQRPDLRRLRALLPESRIDFRNELKKLCS